MIDAIINIYLAHPVACTFRIDDLGAYSIAPHIPTHMYGCAVQNEGARYPYYTCVQVDTRGNVYSVEGRD